jgi:CHASE2 domain-containing sensor protein
MTVSAFFQRTRDLAAKATRPIRRKGWRHWARFAALLALGSYMGHILGESSRFNDWRYWLYQKQTRFERRGPVYPKYTALVLLNDDDYYSDEYQARSKYKRDKLAALLDRLNAAGVNTVAFDIYMTSPFPDRPDYEFLDYRQEDEAFFQAIKRMCNAGRHVVLATEYNDVGTDDKPSLIETPTIYESRMASLPCLSEGHVILPDSDFRTIPGIATMADGRKVDSLALAIIKLTDPIAYSNSALDQSKGFRFGEFLTPDDFSTRDGRQFIFNGIQIKTMDLNKLRQQLADKVVIVGGHWHVAAYNSREYVDMWDSPGGSEPGAMLHANYVEAMRDPGSTFTAMSERSAEIIEWCLAFALALLGALEVHAGWKWAGFILSCIAALLLSYVLLQNLGLFLDFFIPILIILAHTVIEEILEMRHQLHHARHSLQAHAKEIKETVE